MVKEFKLAKYYFWAFPLSILNIIDDFSCVYLLHAKLYPKYAKIDGNCYKFVFLISMTLLRIMNLKFGNS
jgi:hypothetical protein